MSTIFTSLLKSAENTNSAIDGGLLTKAIDSSDIITLGLVYSILHTPETRSRVFPYLNYESYNRLHFKYLPMCLTSCMESEWIEPQHLAGYAIARWLEELWKHREERADDLKEWKNKLECMFRDGDQEARNCIINSVLEHIVSNPEVRKYLSDWRQDPLLGNALLSAEHPHKPIST